MVLGMVVEVEEELTTVEASTMMEKLLVSLAWPATRWDIQGYRGNSQWGYCSGTRLGLGSVLAAVAEKYKAAAYMDRDRDRLAPGTNTKPRRRPTTNRGGYNVVHGTNVRRARH
jgi:hypothetical protein